MGRVLCHLVVSCCSVDPSKSESGQTGFCACDGDRSRHVLQTGAAEHMAGCAEKHDLPSKCQCLDVFDSARHSLLAIKLRGYVVRHRPDVCPNGRHAQRLSRADYLSVGWEPIQIGGSRKGGCVSRLGQ
jgi:hypothetical protein